MHPPRRLFELAARSLENAPRATVITVVRQPSASLMARALLDGVDALRREMGRRGVSPGDLVMVEGLAAGRFVTACLAAWGSDAVVVASDPLGAPGEAARLSAAFPPRWRLTASDEGAGIALAGPASDPPSPIPAGAALIKITSGSAGLPRGVAVSADQLEADGRHIIEGMGVRPDDLNVAAIPLSHSYGMGSLVMPLVIQATPMAIAEAGHPESLVRLLSGEPDMVFPGVPPIFALLGRGEGPAVRPRGLRLCLSAGALLPAQVARDFRSRTGLPVRAFYGTSETGGICFDASDAGDAAEREEGGVGAPLPGVEVSLHPSDGRVVVRSDAVALGYVEEDEGVGRFDGESFLTADLGRVSDLASEPAGLVLNGRVDAVVNVAGRKVDPREVEGALRRIPGVRDAAAMGVPDEARGEAMAAWLETDDPPTRAEVMDRLREHLAPWKMPRRLMFIERLPRTARGKIDTDALRRMLRDAMEEGG